MTDQLRRPANLITLDTALVVLLVAPTNATNDSSTSESWINQLPSPNNLLTLHTDTSLDQTLTDFHTFHSGSACQSIVIWTDKVDAQVNMIAFHALESGYRVFLVARDLDTKITPAVLRLTHVGVSVMSVDEFEAETGIVEPGSQSL